MKRRLFILGSLGVIGTFVCPSIQAAPLPLLHRLKQLYPENSMYQKIADHSASNESVPTTLEAISYRLNISSSSTENTIKLAITKASKADFAAGRTKKVQGWLLSEIEINLCHLLSGQ